MMKPQTFIFFGRSGCGKGTQATLLKEYMEKIDPKNKVLYVETGAKFREFMAKNNYSNGLAKAVIDKKGVVHHLHDALSQEIPFFFIVAFFLWIEAYVF